MCTVCGRQFHRSDYLKLHSFSHTDERPFNCHICGKGFKMNYNLKIHLRNHERQNEILNQINGGTNSTMVQINDEDEEEDENEEEERVEDEEEEDEESHFNLNLNTNHQECDENEVNIHCNFNVSKLRNSSNIANSNDAAETDINSNEIVSYFMEDCDSNCQANLRPNKMSLVSSSSVTSSSAQSFINLDVHPISIVSIGDSSNSQASQGLKEMLCVTLLDTNNNNYNNTDTSNSDNKSNNHKNNNNINNNNNNNNCHQHQFRVVH